MNFRRPGYIDEGDFISAYLTNMGSEAMNVDGSVTAVDFALPEDAGSQWVIGRIMFYMESALAMSAEDFGNIAALGNGVQFLVNGVEVENWKDNIDLVTTFFDADSRTVMSKVDRHMFGRWSFYKAAGGKVGLHVDPPRFVIRIRDDLSGLVALRMKVQGFSESNGE